VVDQFRQRRNVRVRAVDGVDQNGLILGYGFADHFAPHQFAARNLPLLQRNRQINVGILQNMTDREIALRINSTNERVKIRYFLLRRQTLLRARRPHILLAR